MAGVEIVKVKSNKYLQKKENVDVHVVLFPSRQKKVYKQLYEDLQKKWFFDHKQWFDDQEQSISIKFHNNIDEFIDALTLENQALGEPSQVNENITDRRINTIGHYLDKSKRRQICFIDELDTFDFLIRTEDQPLIDLSYLTKYKNVNFVLCLNPKGKRNFNFYENPNAYQHYQILKYRHRNAKKILEFLIFFQKSQKGTSYLKMSKKASLSENALPPVYCEPPIASCGVIWIDVSFDHGDEFRFEYGLLKANEILEKLNTKCVAALVHDNEQQVDEIDKFELPKDVEKLDVHFGDEFNGSEADVVVVAVKKIGSYTMDSFSRARRLLIIITNSYINSTPSLLEEAEKNQYVRKITLKEPAKNNQSQPISTEEMVGYLLSQSYNQQC